MKIISETDVQTILPQLSLSSLLYSQALALQPTRTSTSNPDSPTPQCPPRLSLSTPRYTQLFMPARTDTTIVKVVSVPRPDAEVANGIPGVNLVFDDETGKVTHVVNSTCLTALRTAAGSLLSSLLALGGEMDKVNHVVVFGDGAQAVFHVWLHLRAFVHITSVTLVVGSHRSLTPLELHQKQSSFTSLLQSLCPDTLDKIRFSILTPKTNPQEMKDALGSASLIFTCTPSTQPLFTVSDLTPSPVSPISHGRKHICAVGSYKRTMCELPAELVRTVAENGALMVDNLEACTSEAGCLIKDRSESDARNVLNNCRELGQLIPAPEPEDGGDYLEELTSQSMLNVSNSKGNISIFKSVGVGLQDVEITKLVVQAATHVGTHVSF